MGYQHQVGKHRTSIVGREKNEHSPLLKQTEISSMNQYRRG